MGRPPVDGKQRITQDKKDPKYQEFIPYSYDVDYVLPPDLFEKFVRTLPPKTDASDALERALNDESV